MSQQNRTIEAQTVLMLSAAMTLDNPTGLSEGDLLRTVRWMQLIAEQLMQAEQGRE